MNMGRKFYQGIIGIFCLFILWVPIPSHAQELAPGPAMWHVEGDVGEVYLLGTIHLLPPKTQWQSEELRGIVERANSLTLEVEDALTPSPDMTRFVLQNGMYGADEKLGEHISAESLIQLQALCEKLNIPLEALTRMRPWLASITLTIQYATQQGYDIQSGAEIILSRIFQASGKPIYGLETPLEALKAIADHDDETQAIMLQDAIEQLDDGGQVLNKMHDDWLAGDIRALNETLLLPMAEQQALYQSLLVERNQNWLPKIEVLVQAKGTHLVAVGTAHLIGDDSVVKMLREKGYNVVQISGQAFIE